MIRVAVAGANGRMGSLARECLQNAVDIQYAGGYVRGDDLLEFFERSKPDVVLDFTTHPKTVEVSMKALDLGISPVIGATGWKASEQRQLEKSARERGVGAMLIPNFAIGAVLMMRFAEDAARHFPTVEIVELHHDQKRDKPSGTAALTAERITRGGGPGEVPIHSVRLRGLVAHQEVLFGNSGELLTIRHDSLSRESFTAGILCAVRAVRSLRGLTVGLDTVLGDAKL